MLFGNKATYAANREVKVSVSSLTKRYDDLLVLNDINFDIYKGEMLCIVGPTGCGKTTFLNCLSRFIPITHGSINVDGESADPRKHNIAFVFQEVSAIPWLTVEDNIRFGLRIKRLPEDEIEKRVERMLDVVGLMKYRTYFPQQLSASMEQRVVIARNFAINPDLLLMDEPYGQLDVKLRYYLEDELMRIWKELGSTVAFITHNIEEAVYLAERILILSPKPSTIKEEVIVDLPRPRQFDDPKFVAIRDYVTEKIKWW
ncbi:ABC transporter ATP-binding protein [Desulfovibrio desulfuricans]|uniref:ABC transporter ATP-binding protein n=1 Tax=Desulfovibrio desulfuricans TaxID=876 RepID=A0A4P7UKG6_DESDE|nr:ABC transporter ATP-binding protein [Desulfovibrio desulfuricans]QCC85314.1 ABC transporter ATP-binding protein [Desulfovibrio desulfuricans]